MSEVTYKKIVDVEQIDTLGEGTTLFVNDGGSMKQMGAAALGAVKSVNGVLPDENGNVEDKHLHYIRFLDGSAMVPGMIQCAEYSAVQIRDAFGDAYERPIVIERLVMSASGTTRSVYCQNYTIERDDDGYIYHLNFGDEYADIILNTVLNTITLDPDWVAPEADPEPTGAHQMLVTGADGSVKWEERTHWADSSLDVVLPEVTIDKKIAYLNDYASYTRNLQQGHTYHIVCDGAEYQCSPVWNAVLYSYTIGNASLASLGSDTGEPFFINAHNNTQMTIIYFSSEGQHTIAIDEGIIDTVHPLDPKYLPEDHINKMIDSNEKITALSEELKGNGPHQMLVTGADGSTKWEDRTHWEEVIEAVTEVPDTTFASTIDAGQGVAMLSVAPNVTAIGDKREIIYDGVSYVCEAAEFQYTPGVLYLGNASIMGAGDDSGEPFFWIINSKTSTTFVNTDTVATAHTVSCKTVRAETVHTLDPKYLPEDHINGLIDSKLEGAGGGATTWDDLGTKEISQKWSGEFTIEDTGSGFGGFQIGFEGLELIEGQSFVIEYNGIEYNLVASLYTAYGKSFVACGNAALMNPVFGTNYEDTGEPFLIQATVVFTTATSGTAQISISTCIKEIVTVPEEYIPPLVDFTLSPVSNGYTIGIVESWQALADKIMAGPVVGVYGKTSLGWFPCGAQVGTSVISFYYQPQPSDLNAPVCVKWNKNGTFTKEELANGLTEEDVNSMIDSKLGVIENGTY